MGLLFAMPVFLISGCGGGRGGRPYRPDPEPGEACAPNQTELTSGPDGACLSPLMEKGLTFENGFDCNLFVEGTGQLRTGFYKETNKGSIDDILKIYPLFALEFNFPLIKVLNDRQEIIKPVAQIVYSLTLTIAKR